MKQFLTALLAAALLLSHAFAMDSEEQARDEAADEIARAAVADCIDDSMSDVEKLTALHDWLALHCDYGATLRCSTAYGALVERTANCIGYAAAYARLATFAGLDGTPTYSESLDHAWILVTLDGTRYFTDCTWDDGKKQRMGLIRHTYWLFDESNADEVGHRGWNTAEAVPGGALENAPWRESVTRVIFRDQYAYYIDGGFTLWRCDRETWEAEPLAQLGEAWPDRDPDDNTRVEIYTSLLLLNDRLYYNTPYAICSVDLNGGAGRVIVEPDTSQQLIYGIGVRGGHLCYTLAASESAVAYDIVETRLIVSQST